MSTGLPYLRSLRKSDLVVLAELADLKDFEDYKKTELEIALDKHLFAHKSSSLANATKLAPYYRRLSHPPRGSPVKKEPKADTSSIDMKRSTRSRESKLKEEVEATDESSSEASEEASQSRSPSLPAETPSRPGLKFPSLPPSPAVVTEAIDRQTVRVRKSVSEAWNESGLTERTHALRSCLSSVNAIEVLTFAIELYGLGQDILPWKYLTTIPAMPSVYTSDYAIKIPDLFVLLSASFWSPFLIWLTTSLVLPALFSYFININMKVTQPASAAASHTYGTRRAAATAVSAQAKPRSNFDPLVFNVSKALVSYLVYANRFNFWDLVNVSSVDRVARAVPGGLPGILTGSAVCTLGSLYEAILRK